MLGFFELLAVPFTGVLVRYRSASHPKTAVEDGSLPPPPTFISIAKRVHRLQGFEGLTRGLMPTIGYTLFFFFFWPFWGPKFYLSPFPPASERSGLFSILLSTAFYTFFLVAAYRSITSPRKLDVLNAREALHILFTVHERKKPSVILQTPGLLPAILLNVLFYHFVVRSISQMIYPYHTPEIYSFKEEWIRRAGLVVLALFSTAICTPLEVIATRLALQRNYGGLAIIGEATPAQNTVAPAATPSNEAAVQLPPAPVDVVSETPTQPADPVAEKPEYPVDKPAETAAPLIADMATQLVVPADSERDLERGLTPFVDSDDVVVHLHNENEPYLGLVDCYKRIVAEEGWEVLYRMWFVTFLGSFI
ncbi:mitochondrial carrier [Favolaschia claudopus]|uniref:Mitochondrial carrier n=1 Tax=Favolaschia claudopus TaxID=2862362 RepID=A0AAW0C2R9_9AGAR